MSALPNATGMRVRLGLRALACVLMAMAAWAFGPRPTQEAELGPALRVLLLDASASSQRPQRAWLPWAREQLFLEAQAAEQAGEQVALISFARDVGVVLGPSAPRELRERLRGSDGAPLDPRPSAGARDGSALVGALELASSLVLEPGRRTGRLVLIGCDGFTGASPGPELARLARAGVGLEQRPAPAAYHHDLRLAALRLPPEVEPGAPLLAMASLDYSPGSAALEEAYLEVELRHGAELQSQRIPFELPPLGGAFDVPIACGPAEPGRTELRVRVRSLPLGVDAMPENDSLRASTRAAGARVVLVVAHPDRQAAARAWLAPTGASGLAGLQFVFAEPGDLGRYLGELDALVSYDVPLKQLPAPLVDDLVRRGGGLLVSGGWRFLEDWAHGQPLGPLGELMPATPEPRAPAERDVVLLVDGSGSMSGAPFDAVRSACLDLVRNAAPEDRVLLRFFTIDLHQEHLIKPRQRTGAELEDAQVAAGRLLELHVPEGSTHILESLESFGELARPGARETLLFVLTDGIELDVIRDLEQRVEALHAGLLQSRIQIIPIAIGEKHDLEFLQLLARPGQDVAQPAGLDELRELFRREISGARWRAAEDAGLALEWAPGEPGELSLELRGEGASPIPSIQRLIKNQAKPWGQVLWLGDLGEPVLVAGAVGAGRVALLASLAGKGWAPAWSGRAGFGQPAEFENLLRWLCRRPARAPEGVELRQRGRSLELVGLDPTWPASLELSLLDALDREGREHLRLSFTPPSAGGAIRARRGALLPAQLDLAALGAPVLRLAHPDGRLQLLPLELPRAQEFLAQEPLEASWFEPKGVVSERPEWTASSAPSPAAPYLLAAGLLALFLGFVRLPQGNP